LPTACQHQLGHGLQIDDIGLDGALAQHPTLLGDMTRVELEHLPVDRPRCAQQRPVIMPSSFDTDLHPCAAREHPGDVSNDLRQRRAGHRTAGARLQQRHPRPITHRERELGLANIDRDNDRRRRNTSSFNNHGTHLRTCHKATAHNARPSDEWNLSVPSKHLRRCP
jgi:hypothetical protein